MDKDDLAIEDGCYAVIFYSERREGDDGYAATAQRMAEKAAASPGYLGVQSVRDQDGRGITVSYWRSEEDIARWKADAEHHAAQVRGRNDWYKTFRLTVARVVRDKAVPGK